MKALGVIFDNKLSWSKHVHQTVNTCKKTLHGLKTIRKYYSKEEFIGICTSLYYSKLYYGCDIWLNPCLSHASKNKLESAHRSVLRLIELDFNHLMSPMELQRLSKRATPFEWSNFVHAKLLYNIIYNQDPFDLYSDLLANIYFERRYPHRPKVILNKGYRRYCNVLTNRLHFITKAINFDWYETNATFSQFKSSCKKLFFSYLK